MTSLFLMVNSACDIACTYCFYTTGYEKRSRDRILPRQAGHVAKRIAEARFGTVILTGGDPLHSVHKKETYELVSALKANALRIIINTSATRLSERSLRDVVRALTGAHADDYRVKNIELRNDSCPMTLYPVIIERFQPDMETMRKEGFKFTLHGARAIDHSDHLDQDILDVLQRDSDLAKALGISLMVTHASFSIRAPEGKTYYSIMHLLPKLNAMSQKSGVKIAIENISLKNDILQNTNDHLFVLDDINKNGFDHLGIALDFGHALSCGFGTEYVVHVIEKAREKFFHIHAHETAFGEDLHMSISGKLEWSKVFQALENIAYTGTFVLEVRSPNIAPSLEYLKSIHAPFGR